MDGGEKGACFSIAPRKCVQTVCIWARRARFFILLLSFQLQDRGVNRVRRAHPREERTQTKEQTMKKIIGLDKGAKGEELGYDEGESCPDVQGVPGHGKCVG
jgi:hypothetical protein